MFEKFFHCDRRDIELAKVVCVQLQERAKVKGASKALTLQKCRACDQGKEIAESMAQRAEEKT